MSPTSQSKPLDRKVKQEVIDYLYRLLDFANKQGDCDVELLTLENYHDILFRPVPTTFWSIEEGKDGETVYTDTIEDVNDWKLSLFTLVRETAKLMMEENEGMDHELEDEVEALLETCGAGPRLLGY